MKRFLKKLGKGCGYVVLYLLVAIGTAVGILFLSPAGNTNVSANEIPVQLQQLWQNLQAQNAIEIDLNASVNTTNILLNAKLDLSNGFDKLKAEAKATIDLGEENFDLGLFYGDGQIFLEALNGKFKMSTDSLGDTIGKITTLLGVELPDLGGIDLENLDVNMILGFLSDLTETRNKDGVKLSINISMLEPALQFDVFCDNDYNLKKIEIPQTEMGGTSFAVSLDLNCPENIETQMPEEEKFIDISDLMGMASVALETLQTDTLGFDVSVTLEDGKIFEGNFNGDLKNLNAMFETEIMDLPLKVAVYKDSIFYFEFGNIYLKFAFDDVDKLTEFLQKHFDISVPIEQITQILSAIQEKEILKILPALSFGKEPTSVGDIDLSVLEGLSHEKDEFVVSLRDIGHITMLTSGKTLKSIAFEGLGILAKVDITSAKEVQIADVDHADLAKIIPAVDAVLETLKQDKISGKAEISLGGIFANANFAFDMSTKQLELQATTNIMGIPVMLTYQNQKVFAEISGIKVFANEDDFGYISQMFNLDLGEKADLEKLVGFAKELIDPKVNEKFISLWNGDDGLEIGILDKVIFDLKFDDKLKSLKVKAGDVEAFIELGEEFDMPRLDETQFESASKVADKVQAILEYVKAEKFYVSANADLGEVTLDGFVNFDQENGFDAEIDIVAYGQTAKLRAVGSEIFLDIKDLHFKADLKNWKELLSVVGEEFGLDVEKYLAEVETESEKLKDLTDGKVDVLKLLENKELEKILAKLWLGFENENLKVTFEDLCAFVKFGENNMISEIEVQYQDLGGTARIENKRTQITPFEEDVQYVEVNEVLRKAGAVWDYVQGGQYYVTLSGAYGELVSFDGVLNFDKDGLQSDITISSYGQTAKIKVRGSLIYLDVKGIHLYADLKDWKELLGVVGEEFGIDFNELLGKVNLDVDTLDKVLSGKENFDIKQLTGGKELDLAEILNNLELGFANNLLSIEYQDIKAGITFVGNMISLAEVSYKDFFAQIEIKNKASEISPLDESTTYSEVNEVLRKAGAVWDYVQGGQYYVTLSGAYGELVSFDGVLNFEGNTLKAELNVSAYGQSGKIRIFGTNVYVDVKDVHIVADISNWRDILNLVEDAFGLNLEDLHKTLDGANGEFSKDKIEGLLDKVGISYENEKLVIYYDGLTATINFEKDMIYSAVVTFDTLTATATIQNEAGRITELGETVYEPIENIIAKAGYVFDYVQNKAFYINDINLTIDGKYTILGFVNFDQEDGLSASLSTSISGVDISAKILDNVIYLKVANLNLEFEIADIETVLYFLRDEFGLDFVETYKEYEWIVEALTIQKDINFSDLAQLGDGKTLDIADTLRKLGLSLKGDVLNATFSNPNLSATVTFLDEKLSTIFLQMDKFTLSANLQGRQHVQIGEETYFDIVDILPVVTSIKNYLFGREYNLTANAEVFEGETKIYDAKNIVLQVDATKNLQFYADAHVLGVDGTKSAGFDLKLNASMFEDYLYFDYNGLCLKLNNDGVQSILSIVCEIFGIDPSMLSFITGKESEASGIDTSFVTKLLPGVDTSNPVGLLNIIKEFSMNGRVFDITLDGSALSGSEGAENMHIQICMDEFGELEKIVIKNLYTGVTANEHFNLEVNFAVLDKMTQPDKNKKYIDLTGAEDLIKAVINTISHKTFEITGNLKVDMNVIGINIKWNIPLVVQIKLVDGKLEVYAQIGAIPVPVGGVINNDTPWTLPKIENRMLYIYYKDDYVYFYRHESRKRGDTYEKKLKAHLETVMDDVLYYVQWGTGFTDDIINAIRKSLAIEHDINLGNIIKQFTLPKENDPYYTISLNMEELTGDDKMGTMSIGIGLSDFSGKNEEGNSYTHKVVGQLTFNMDMPLISGTTLYLQSNNPDGSENLYLALDKDLDFKGYDDFVNGYEYPENVEYDAENGKWTKAAERQFTVTFETNRKELTENSVTGLKGTKFTLPNYTQEYEDVVYDESGTETERTKVRFVGWFTDSNFSSGSEFTEGVIPRHSVTLYAKWEIVKEGTWRTVYYHDTDGTLKATQYALIGSELRTDIEEMGIKRKKNESDGFAYAVEFDGWVDVDDAPFTQIPDYSINLYPHYKADESLIKHTLSFSTGFGPTLHDMQFYGNTADIRGLSNAFDRYGNAQFGEDIFQASEDYTYRFEGWFFDEDFTLEYDFAMPTHDLTIYAKWTEIMEWKFQIYDNGVGLLHDENGGDLYLKKGTKIVPYAADKQVGENEFMLPESVNVKTVVQDERDSVTEWYFGYDNGVYTDKASLPDKMTNGDLELHIRNKYHVKYDYYVLENISERYSVKTPDYEIVIATLPAKQNRTFDEYLWQNEKFDLLQTEFYADSYKSGKTLNERVEYKFKYSNGLSGTTAMVANHDMIFSSEIDQATTKHRAWHYIKFDVSFVYPSSWNDNNNKFTGKITLVQAPTKVNDVAILDGDTLDPSKYSSTAKYDYTAVWITASYTFKTLSWSLDKCQNASDGATNIHDYNVLAPFQVFGDTTLHAIWGK